MTDSAPVLVIDDDAAHIRDFQRPYARPSAEVSDWQRTGKHGGIVLEEVVRQVRPTILIGTSTQTGAFNQAVVTKLPAAPPHFRTVLLEADLGRRQAARKLVFTVVVAVLGFTGLLYLWQRPHAEGVAVQRVDVGADPGIDPQFEAAIDDSLPKGGPAAHQEQTESDHGRQTFHKTEIFSFRGYFYGCYHLSLRSG